MRDSRYEMTPLWLSEVQSHRLEDPERSPRLRPFPLGVTWRFGVWRGICGHGMAFQRMGWWVCAETGRFRWQSIAERRGRSSSGVASVNHREEPGWGQTGRLSLRG